MHDSLAHSAADVGGPVATAPRRDRRSETAAPSGDGRRRNQTLRSLVDGLLDHVRDLSETVDALTPEEIEGAHRRFNHVAELMWAVITDEKNRSRDRARRNVAARKSPADAE